MNMTHAPQIGAINRLHFSGAGFWYVCHPDSSGTRFRRRLEHCSVPGHKVTYDWAMINYCLRSNVPSCCKNLSSTSLSAMFIFGARNYHSRRTWCEKPAPKTGAMELDLWRRCLERVSWVLVSSVYSSVLRRVLRERVADTWPRGHSRPRHECIRRGDEVQGWMSHVSGSQSCPWWPPRTDSASDTDNTRHVVMATVTWQQSQQQLGTVMPKFHYARFPVTSP